MLFFNGIPVAEPIEVFHKNKLYLQEQDPLKVNLTIGAYRTEENKPWVLPVVQQAERDLALDEKLNHEYLPVLGLPEFTDAAVKLVLGDDSPAVKDGRAFGVQCLSGTGSLRAGAEFLKRLLNLDAVLVSQPTWGNHKLIFHNAGFTSVKAYRYWDAGNKKIDIDGFLADLQAAPEKAVVVLHGCAHNPTGMDPSQDEWKKICEVVKQKNLFTFFDIAYQGFASGDPDKDAWAIRYFVEQGLEMVVAQSFAKNFGLYNERVGNLAIVVNDKSTIEGIKSQIQLVIRANWSNPPAHGARIVAMVLNDPTRRQQWYDAIKTMSSRIQQMREALLKLLTEQGTPGKWDHIVKQIGMFSYTGLTKEQVDRLINVHKVFLLNDGRINICGLNTKNVEKVAKAIDETVRNIPSRL
ncbi:unnamed protein product [Bursaphelenchus okinawaensis]|uniref:Aspartate aminotransferase n=1 Tax=Bursaphelenchus okinawaensis TaxID=465554 RepID=A0A811LR21_9BILA|nr:unnamed protein product [Bursaphelenchus okinawaensis]CAG9127024.1 unnamed protein product [Bursaphelenchus okinawaensis]